MGVRLERTPLPRTPIDQIIYMQSLCLSNYHDYTITFFAGVLLYLMELLGRSIKKQAIAVSACPSQSPAFPLAVLGRPYIISRIAGHRYKRPSYSTSRSGPKYTSCVNEATSPPLSLLSQQHHLRLPYLHNPSRALSRFKHSVARLEMGRWCMKYIIYFYFKVLQGFSPPWISDQPDHLAIYPKLFAA
jgi:hypothetical protein